MLHCTSSIQSIDNPLEKTECFIQQFQFPDFRNHNHWHMESIKQGSQGCVSKSAFLGSKFQEQIYQLPILTSFNHFNHFNLLFITRTAVKETQAMTTVKNNRNVFQVLKQFPSHLFGHVGVLSTL